MAEERHFTRAAERLGIAQSTISSSVQALEREFGVALFTRTTRRVELSQAGSAMLADARRTLAAAAAAQASVEAVTGLRRGRVAIGTGKAVQIDIAGGLERFCAAHPGIDLSMEQGGSMQLLEAVSEGRLDFAPLGLVPTLPESIRGSVAIAALHHEPMVLACARSHRLAERTRIGLLDVADEAFADFAPDWAIRIVNDQTFAELGRERRVAFEMTDVDDLLEIVGRGLGVAVIPTSARRATRRVRFLELRKPTPIWRVGVAVPRGQVPSPAARALLETLLPGVSWPT